MKDTDAVIEHTPRRTVLCPHDLGLDGLMLVGRAQFTQTVRDGMEEHDHGPCMEILYLEKGEQDYRVDGQVYHLTGGDVYLTFPQERHGTGAHLEEPTSLYWIQVDLDLQGSFLRLDPEFGDALRAGLSGIRQRHFRGSARLKRLCEEMLRQLMGQDSLCLLRAQQAAVSFLLEILELEGRPAKEFPAEPLKPAMDYLEQNLQEPISVAHLAKLCYMSDAYFRCRFRQQTGLPPQEYAMRCKITAAKNLLCRGGRITDVAEATGFSSASYFTAQFKKYTSFTPTEYRDRQTLGTGSENYE